MLYSYCCLFLYFYIFSILGYIIEVLNVSISTKKLTLSRGFLIGPYLPIYGVGSLVMTFFLEKYRNDVLVLFVMGMVICSILEYITSYVMEKIFNVRWWDYSHKKYNVDGRICLENGFLFGLGGVFVVKVLNPVVYSISKNLSHNAILYIGIFFTITFVIDLIETLYIMSKLKINSSKFVRKDATSEVRKQIKNELYKHNTLTLRLIKSFPNINKSNRYIDFNKTVFKIKEEVKKLKQEQKLKQMKEDIKREKKELKKMKKQKKRS